MTKAYVTCLLLLLCTSLPVPAFTEAFSANTPTAKAEAEQLPEDQRWAQVFGDLSRLIETARSEQELDAALSGIRGQAELLGKTSIDLLFEMAERRRDDLDPLSDAVIADLAELLGRVAQERISESDRAGEAPLAGLDAQMLYIERIETWCVQSTDCNLADRRRCALELAREMLALPAFWIESSQP